MADVMMCERCAEGRPSAVHADGWGTACGCRACGPVEVRGGVACRECGDVVPAVRSVRDCAAWCECSDCTDTVRAFTVALAVVGCERIAAEQTGGGCMWLAGVVGGRLVAVTGGTTLTEAGLPTDAAAAVVGIYAHGWEEDYSEPVLYVETSLSEFVADVSAALATVGGAA